MLVRINILESVVITDGYFQRAGMCCRASRLACGCLAFANRLRQDLHQKVTFGGIYLADRDFQFIGLPRTHKNQARDEAYNTTKST